MDSYFGQREGGGVFDDLYHPMDQRHLRDHVGACLSAEAPFAHWKRVDEQRDRAARDAYTMANNSNVATKATAKQTFVRIEGGRPVTYYGKEASDYERQQQTVKQHMPKPPILKHAVDEGLLIDGEEPTKTSGRRKVPPAPPTSGQKSSDKRAAYPGEVPLFGGGPRTVIKEYHNVDPGYGGEPTRNILYNDRAASGIPSKKEYTLVSKASLPNRDEEDALAQKQRTRAHSARLPTVWKRPNYLHGWMMEDARKDDAVFKSSWRQQRDRELRREHATINANVDYSRLKGAALSINSPRYLAEEKRRQEEEMRLQRRTFAEKELAAREHRLAKDRLAQEAAASEAVGPQSSKRLSSNMRRKIAAAFDRLQI